MPIQKSAANTETFTLGGATVETHDTAGIIQVQTSFAANTLQATFADGTPASNAFASFARAKTFTLTINLVNGVWTTSAGTTGTLTGGQLTALNNNQRTLKNGLENVANAVGLLPGTIVTWT